MLLLGILGLTANIASVWVLSGGRDHNLNMRAAFLEVVNDAFGSIAVIASALVIQYTGWTQADALAGMLISILIVPRALRILRQAGSVLLETVPEGLHLDDVCTFQLETSQPHQPRKRHPRLKQRPRGRERGVRFRDEGQHRSNTVVSRRRGFRLPPTLFGTLTSARTTL